MEVGRNVFGWALVPHWDAVTWRSLYQEMKKDIHDDDDDDDDRCEADGGH
jgi:hypothetical protein